jgi:hypothetical protein
MRPIAIAALLFTAVAAQAAGTVKVAFVEAERFTDAGRSPSDRAANLRVLEQHLGALGQRHLADGQSLTLEITDVDLAGSLKPWRHSAEEIRVVRGMADWPRITLRYTLETPGQTVSRGEAQIADMNYTGHIATYSSGDPLRYEKQMLDAWFKSTFAAPQ